jgi:hypothetical protein
VARLRNLPRQPATVLTTRYLMRVSVMALDRWDRLTPAEQARYRVLARQAGVERKSLPKDERKELKAMWRKLEPRKFIAEAVKLLATRERPGGRDQDGL